MITINLPSSGWFQVTLCPWVPVDKVTVPKFIEERAKGNMRMIDGKPYERARGSLSKPSPNLKWRWEKV